MSITRFSGILKYVDNIKHNLFLILPCSVIHICVMDMVLSLKFCRVVFFISNG